MSDKNFYLDAYFGQRRGSPLFSDLISKDIAGKKVLEIGCGLGAHTEALIKMGAKVTAVDIAPRSVEITKRRLKLKGLEAKVIEADAEKLPFKNNCFDFIWSWGVIHHSPNTIQCGKEISRVLKLNGEVAIMLYNKNSFYNWFNVIFRYGILKGKLFTHTLQELHNRYTDGKAINGAPLSKYYSKKEIHLNILPDFCIYKQICFEKKHAFSFLFHRHIEENLRKLYRIDYIQNYGQGLGFYFLVQQERLSRIKNL